jgi:phosphatidylserine/phosphatidylglycerophosphate/cardiolipin synthase-like enzyme
MLHQLKSGWTFEFFAAPVDKRESDTPQQGPTKVWQDAELQRFAEHCTGRKHMHMKKDFIQVAECDADRTKFLDYSCSDVDLLVDGPAAFAAMLDAIGQARSHIHIEIYIYKSVSQGQTGQRFAQALREKIRQGVEVCLIYDPAGSRAAPRSFFAHLAADGIRVLEYNPVNPFRAIIACKNRGD